jgi:MoxR-like ATPase
MVDDRIDNDRIDLSVSFSKEHYEQFPEWRTVERAGVEPVPAELTDADREEVRREVYRASKDLEDAVNLAIALGRPLLLQGEPGCGKTRLAYAVAYALQMPLEIAPIKSTSRAQDLLYTYDAVQRLYDAQIKPEDGKQRSLDAHQYIKLGPLGRAIVRAEYGRRSVVLIDEIDKADLDFPNDLLWELDRLEFHIPESNQSYKVGNAKTRPIVLVTHNEEKALPTAFLRRCIFHYIAFPTQPDELWRIIEAHHVADEELGRRAIKVLLQLREIPDLTKHPGVSELLDWTGYAAAVKTPLEDLGKLPYIGALLKQQSDWERARKELLSRERVAPAT